MHIDRRASRLLGDPISNGDDDELLTTRQMADWFQCSEEFLEIKRHKGGDGPPFVHVAPNMVRYPRGGARQWLRKREQYSTAQNQKPRGKASVAKGGAR
jgi:hypothetical protein